MTFLDSKRIVLKIGSALFIDPRSLIFNHAWFDSFIDDVFFLRHQGIEVILVSSGSLALGKVEMNFRNKNLSLEYKQALSAIGQFKFSQYYQNALSKYQLKSAQILITIDDTENRRRYLNAHNTFETLLEFDVIPIVNENDTVATAEMCYGDNDRLAARVAQMINADALILLSDIDGLYSADPNVDRNAKFINDVPELNEEIMAMGQSAVSKYGTGGMRTKLQAAKIATASGCDMYVISGRQQNPIQSFIKTGRGTKFHANLNRLNAKKIWLQEHLNPQGFIYIDNGALRALKSGNSLLPIGIVNLKGHFQKGDTITILDMENNAVAKGLSNYDSKTLEKVIGKSSEKFFDLIGFEGSHEAVHRDNLVLLSNERH